MAKLSPSTLRIGYRYRPKRLAPDYDVIVIGSGMGGLTTAALLSDLGKKVCVLEQHYTAGGFTHSYERAGYEWDVGVHYIGEVGAPTRTRKMFDYLSDGKLEWAPMDAEYDRFYVGDKVFNAIAGKREFLGLHVRLAVTGEVDVEAHRAVRVGAAPEYDEIAGAVAVEVMPDLA